MRHALALGDDRQGVGIPLGQLVAFGHLLALVLEQAGAVGHAMARLLAAVVVDEDDLAVARHHHQLPLAVGHHVAVDHLHVVSKADSMLDCSAPLWAAPPMWNVRIVSWVPGSPIDWPR